MVGALQCLADELPIAQGRKAMRAAITQRDSCSVRQAHEHDDLTEYLNPSWLFR
jgi:hypothetical protein